MNKLHACPCCGSKTLKDVGEFDICNVCKWEDDPLQRKDPNDDMGANTMSLNDYRRDWQRRNQVRNRQAQPA